MMVFVAGILTAPLYVAAVAEEVGSLPSVVYLIVAPRVVVEITTFCALV